jgi:hypothetical protein
MVWDNASWHIGQAGCEWLAAHKQRVKREGACRVVQCPLPRKEPWLHRTRSSECMVSGPLSLVAVQAVAIVGMN